MAPLLLRILKPLGSFASVAMQSVQVSRATSQTDLFSALNDPLNGSCRDVATLNRTLSVVGARKVATSS